MHHFFFSSSSEEEEDEEEENELKVLSVVPDGTIGELIVINCGVICRSEEGRGGELEGRSEEGRGGELEGRLEEGRGAELKGALKWTSYEGILDSTVDTGLMVGRVNTGILDTLIWG